MRTSSMLELQGQSYLSSGKQSATAHENDAAAASYAGQDDHEIEEDNRMNAEPTEPLVKAAVTLSCISKLSWHVSFQQYSRDNHPIDGQHHTDQETRKNPRQNCIGIIRRSKENTKSRSEKEQRPTKQSDDRKRCRERPSDQFMSCLKIATTLRTFARHIAAAEIITAARAVANLHCRNRGGWVLVG